MHSHAPSLPAKSATFFYYLEKVTKQREAVTFSAFGLSVLCFEKF